MASLIVSWQANDSCFTVFTSQQNQLFSVFRTQSTLPVLPALFHYTMVARKPAHAHFAVAFAAVVYAVAPRTTEAGLLVLTDTYTFDVPKCPGKEKKGNVKGKKLRV